MNQPLGKTIGNNLEIKEVIETLKELVLKIWLKFAYFQVPFYYNKLKYIMIEIR